jgi:Glu-tRNA(Gln) amidotransferase subunit E-like FAD-binding protein
MEDCCEKDLNQIKKDYSALAKTYKLPSWTSLEEDFDVSKAFSGENELILRDIRRKMNEKIASYLHLFETFMNPQSAPMFIMSVLKNLDEKDWESIKRIYSEIAKIQFKQILVDTIYSEQEEAKLINFVSELWLKEKTEISKIISTLDKKYSENSLEKKKSYFG